MRWSLLWNVMDSCTTCRFEMSLIKDRAAIVHMHCTGCWSHAKLVSPRPVRVTESGSEDHQHRAPLCACWHVLSSYSYKHLSCLAVDRVL
jgi:hypothetical protein